MVDDFDPAAAAGGLLGCLSVVVIWLLSLAIPTLIGLWLLDLFGIVEVWR
jgi:hypothetical protein